MLKKLIIDRIIKETFNELKNTGETNVKVNLNQNGELIVEVLCNEKIIYNTKLIVEKIEFIVYNVIEDELYTDQITLMQQQIENNNLILTFKINQQYIEFLNGEK
jgi:hypothetical protein